MELLGDELKKLMEERNIPLNHNLSKEDVAEFQNKQAEKYTQQFLNRKYTKMFTKDSLFSDPDLKDASFDNFMTNNTEQDNNKKLARKFAYDYCQGGKFNTLLVGSAGRGKTHLAIGMLKAINNYMHQQNKYYSCLFMDVNEMVTRMMDYEFHGGNDKYSRYHMEQLCNQADLLVLDDLGTESSMKSDDTEANNMTQKLLYNILNSRNETIITTNLSSAQMYKVYNPKLVSRIKRNIGNHIIKFTNDTKDMRQGNVAW